MLVAHGRATLELSPMANNQHPNQEREPRQAKPGRQDPDMDRNREREDSDEQRIDKHPERDQERPQ